MPKDYGPMKRAPHDPNQIVMTNKEAKARGLLHTADDTPDRKATSNELAYMKQAGSALRASPPSSGNTKWDETLKAKASLLEGLLSKPKR